MYKGTGEPFFRIDSCARVNALEMYIKWSFMCTIKIAISKRLKLFCAFGSSEILRPLLNLFFQTFSVIGIKCIALLRLNFPNGCFVARSGNRQNPPEKSVPRNLIF